MNHGDFNSLSSALQQGELPGDHPDADSLTAFSEGTLLERERTAVLAHIAFCQSCRHLLNLAADAESATLMTKPLSLKPRKWESVRIWIPSLAAAAVIIVVTAAVLRDQVKTPEQRSATAIGTPAQQAEATAVASNPPPSGSTGTTQQPVSAFPNAAGASTTGLAASEARPHWRINEQGQPERSIGGGPFEPALPGNSVRMHVLSVGSTEVWIGGENSTVMRSPDNGSTWHSVSLPVKNGRAHIIAHIRFETAHAITVEAADGTTWSSADGGETWK